VHESKVSRETETEGVPKHLDTVLENAKSISESSSSVSSRSWQDSLEKTQENVIPGTELQMPPLPQVVLQHESTSQDDASYDPNDDAGSE
jgi:hypothetical protein